MQAFPHRLALAATVPLGTTLRSLLPEPSPGSRPFTMPRSSKSMSSSSSSLSSSNTSLPHTAPPCRRLGRGDISKGSFVQQIEWLVFIFDNVLLPTLLRLPAFLCCSAKHFFVGNILIAIVTLFRFRSVHCFVVLAFKLALPPFCAWRSFLAIVISGILLLLSPIPGLPDIDNELPVRLWSARFNSLNAESTNHPLEDVLDLSFETFTKPRTLRTISRRPRNSYSILVKAVIDAEIM
ncbi:hypothetical protein KC344_g80 [Hortaea werneckii]|nr:hypothetical protein KC344_g80 [Hortaea werneckii]